MTDAFGHGLDRVYAQRERFEQLGFEFRTLEGAQRDWPTAQPDDWMRALVGTAWGI